MTTLEHEVGSLTARISTVETELRAMRSDIREIRDTLVGVKGGWKIVMFALTLATGFGALAGQYLPLIGRGKI